MRVLVVLVLALVVVVRSGDIYICEGRVNVPDTATGSSNIDLTKNVRVELASQSGVVKFTTEPDPSGRFVLPIYEQGRYVISVQGPPGWQMEPYEVAVHVDGSHCFAEFSFAGFGLSGRIEGSELCADSIPLVGYEVELLNSAGDAVSSTLTDSNGSYNIKSVIPGKYRLKINEKSDNSDVHFKQNELSVDVSLEGGVVTDGTFVISGFDVRARLVAGSDHAGVPGVVFLLFSDQVASVPCPSPPPTSSGALCSTVSDQEGAVLFSLLPCGGYRLVPSVSPSTFKISPSEASVAVESGSVDVHTPFEVTGIALKGSVAVPGALVTAEHLATGARSTTSSDPSTGCLNVIFSHDRREYFFEALAPGVYKLSAEKEHYVFEELSEFEVLAKLPRSVPEPVKAIKFDVCGQVKAAEGAALAVSTINQRVLARGNSYEISTKTDSKGEFCLSLPRGTHTLTLPDLSTFAPVKVIVKEEPILDVSFALTRVSVGGKVTSTGELPTLSLELLYEGENQVLKTAVVDSEGKFAFEDLTAGEYIVRVAATEACVADDSRMVHVGSDDINDLEFHVAGYVQLVSADRKLSAVLECADSAVCGGSVETVSLRKGSNWICVPMRAKYSLRIVQGEPEPDCVYFIDTNQAVSDRAPLGSLSFPVDTTSSESTKSLDLVGYSFLLHGAINVHAEKLISVNDLTVTAVSSTRANGPEVAIEAATGTKGVFKYSVRVLVGENVKLSFASKALYFEPATLSYALSERECPPPLPVVTGRVPLVVSGSIRPPVDGVSIAIVDAETRKSLLTVPLTTDADGKYTSEPLRTNGRIVVTPSRIGYTFAPLAAHEHSFTSAQLAGISVHLRPCKDGEEGAVVDKSIEKNLSGNVSSLSGALIALSAEQGGMYSNTSNENGRATFLELSPGSYYVRALAKEFTFLPVAQKVDLPSGAHVHVKLCAQRVAFSTLGCIKSLNGDPERQLAVEATELIENGSSSEPHKEDALTDQNGCYRLRGLKPSAKYAVTLRDKDERNLRVHRISPLKRVISTPALSEVNAGDVANIDFTAMRRPPRVAIRGYVSTKDDFLSSLRVLLLSAPENEKPEVLSEISLFPFGTFHFVVDAQKNYTIRLMSNLSRVIYDYDVPEVPVVLVNDPVSLEIEFNTQRKFEGSETDQSSLIGFWLLILAVALFYYREQVMVLVNHLCGKKPAVSLLADDRHNDWQSGWNHKKPKRR